MQAIILIWEINLAFIRDVPLESIMVSLNLFPLQAFKVYQNLQVKFTYYNIHMFISFTMKKPNKFGYGENIIVSS